MRAKAGAIATAIVTRRRCTPEFIGPPCYPMNSELAAQIQRPFMAKSVLRLGQPGPH